MNQPATILALLLDRIHLTLLLGLLLSASAKIGTTQQLGTAAPSGTAKIATMPNGERQRVIRTGTGERIGLGTNYRAEFASDRVQVEGLPELSFGTIPRFSFSFTGARRGAVADPRFAARIATAQLVDRARRVDYVRGLDTLVERYDVRRNGLKQSFVFHQLPAGSGDLIVTGLVSSNRGLELATDDELRFGSEADGIRVTDVLGIDANGAEVRGKMRCENGELQLVLPAAFVDEAALPLTLDPLIGLTQIVPNGFDGKRPDVAYDAAADLYLIVWQRGATGAEQIVGQRLRGNGTPIGGLVLISNMSGSDEPSVANVRLRGAFVVVWESFGNVHTCSVEAATGAVSPPVPVAFGNDIEHNPDVGGEATFAADDALVVWHNETLDRIESAQIEVSPSLQCSVHDFTILSGPAGTSNADRKPAIAKSGGPSGDYLVVWDYGVPGFTGVRGRLVDRQLTALGASFAIEPIGPRTHVLPDVDGNGCRWLVAMESYDDPADRDIACRGVDIHRDVTPRVFVESTLMDDEQDPAVCWIGDSALVAFADLESGSYATFVKSVDMFDCEACEAEELLGSNFDNLLPAMASQHGGGAGDDEALIVWQRTSIGPGNGILARRYQAEDGEFFDHGGGCGTGGTAYGHCARALRGEFTVRVKDAAPLYPTLLVFGTDYLPIPSGGCSLITPNVIIMTGANTGPTGGLRWTFHYGSSPSLVGFDIYAQWAQYRPGTGAWLSVADLSNGLRITLE